MTTVIRKLWLHPPQAIARVGSGKRPLDCYMWGARDLSPRGTGKTTIVPCMTLDIDEYGNVSPRMPESIDFKEILYGKEVFRPACPWFELHGEWEVDGGRHQGILTEAVLSDAGIELAAVKWDVEVANKKAYNMTLSPADIVRASVELAGDDRTPRALQGKSTGTKDHRPLVPEGTSIPLGSVQLSRDGPEVQGLRLRFTPPWGVVYVPKNVRSKIAALRNQYPPQENEEDPWDELNLPEELFVLADDSAWATWQLSDGDARTVPVLQFAYQAGPPNVLNSLGFLDDLSDGTIRCKLPNGMSALARVIVAPPDFAPDRRHFVSLADDLKDRVDRDVEADFRNIPMDEFTEVILDLFLRLYETMGLVNLDAMATKAGFEDENGVFPYSDVQGLTDEPLPLTQHGRRTHRRLINREVLEDMFRERAGRVSIGTPPDSVGRPKRSFEDLFNAPPAADGTTAAGNAYRKMPAMMRGSDGSPMHLTRRQYDMIKLWIERLNE